MNSGFVLEERQRSTKFDPFFGEKPGRGKMIFAERCQVESEEWWSENGRMVELIVQCTGPQKRFNYPPLAARSQVTHVSRCQSRERGVPQRSNAANCRLEFV